MRTRSLVLALALLAPAALASPPACPVPSLYDKKCSVCHGDDGKGQTRMGRRFHAPDFSSSTWQAKAKDATLRQVIEDGAVIDGQRRMPAWRDKLSPKEISDLIHFVRGFGKAAK